MPKGRVRFAWLVLLLLGLAAEMRHCEAATFEIGLVPVGEGKQAALANLGRLPDGTILCAYSAGPGPDAIACVSTRDAGKTWSKPVTVMGMPGPGYIADPNIIVVGQSATVIGTFIPETKPRFARSELWRSTTEDGGKTWGRPVLIPTLRKYTTGKVHPPVRLADGTLVMGYSWETKAEHGQPADSEPKMLDKAGVLRSKDDGHTWTPGADISVDRPMGADEPAIVLLRGGDLFAIVRTGGPKPFEVRSRDGGLTWGEPRESPFAGHNTPSALARLNDGRILRIWDHSEKDRYPLVAAVSSDECQTWSKPRTITEPKPDAVGKLSYATACYPSIAQADDGTVLVVWWETASFGSRLGYARFSPDWLGPSATAN